MDTLTGKMGCSLILSVKMFVKKIKGAVHKKSDVNGIYVNEDLIYVNFETIYSFASKLTLCKASIKFSSTHILVSCYSFCGSVNENREYVT